MGEREEQRFRFEEWAENSFADLRFNFVRPRWASDGGRRLEWLSMRKVTREPSERRTKA